MIFYPEFEPLIAAHFPYPLIVALSVIVSSKSFSAIWETLNYITTNNRMNTLLSLWKVEENSQNFFLEILTVAVYPPNLRNITINVVTPLTNGKVAFISPEGHFNFVGDPFNAHERERYDSYKRNSGPAKVIREGQRQCEQIKRHALLQVDAICR